MLRKAGIAIVTAALGVGAALGVAACGEDREGEVEFEDGAGTTGGPSTTPTVGTETEVETETEAETDTAP